MVQVLQRHAVSARHLTVAVLVIWFVLALVGSLLGVFNSEPSPPIPLGLMAIVPVALLRWAIGNFPAFGSSFRPWTCGGSLWLKPGG